MSKLAWAALLLAAAPLLAMPRKPRVDKSMETNGQHCRVAEPGYRVITANAQWLALWKDLGRPAPAADLTKYFAVAAFAGTRNSGGYSVVFDEPKTQPASILIGYKISRPRGMAIMALTQPYAVKLFPKADRPVKVAGREE